ncbi:MAG TPA: hypothetical protein VLO00_11120 [Cryobacterium sp.]|nr:hypothetical protein [Cryobacterium sp.]
MAGLGIGSLIELAGVAGTGLIGAMPGGLFEIFFAFWLMVRKFTNQAAPTRAIVASESVRP